MEYLNLKLIGNKIMSNSSRTIEVQYTVQYLQDGRWYDFALTCKNGLADDKNLCSVNYPNHPQRILKSTFTVVDEI